MQYSARRRGLQRPAPRARGAALLAAIIFALIAAGAVLLAVPPATADPSTDADFLREWHADGLYASSDQAAITAALTVVSYLDNDPTIGAIDHLADLIVHATDGDGNHHHYTYYEAGEQISLAVRYYGPQHLALLNAYTNPDPEPPTRLEGSTGGR
ncbi:MAG: hypothetical protein JWR11_1892 [Mycobacterium sp.]|jgi:hypothetical protein|nr:hypothetical protein [Mycobacterium sp.]MDT5180826.1 hypothetical protein [Mycobacterium sp.]